MLVERAQGTSIELHLHLEQLFAIFNMPIDLCGSVGIGLINQLLIK